LQLFRCSLGFITYLPHNPQRFKGLPSLLHGATDDDVLALLVAVVVAAIVTPLEDAEAALLVFDWVPFAISSVCCLLFVVGFVLLI
jgi:hypothetical protein